MRPWTACSFPKRVVDENAAASASTLAGTSHHAHSCAARPQLGSLITGARVMPSRVNTVVQPPDSVMTLQPRFVLATRQPSVVAIGMKTGSPSTAIGPITPTGSGMYPTTASQFRPSRLL